MANVIVDGFATYGIGYVNTGDGITARSPIAAAMLSGAYASAPLESLPLGLTWGAYISYLPWDLTNTDLFLKRGNIASSSSGNNPPNGWRRVFPGNQAITIISLYFGMDALPATTANILNFRDGSNNLLFSIGVTSTGALTVTGLSLTATDTLTLYAAGVLVLNVASVVGGTVQPAQIELLRSVANSGAFGSPDMNSYLGNLIIRDGTGTVNKDIVGDRRVATLLPASDDLAHQGWAPQFYKWWGGGILSMTATATTAVSAAASAQTDLGAGDFTLEADVRFQVLPASGNKAVILGK